MLVEAAAAFVRDLLAPTFVGLLSMLSELRLDVGGRRGGDSPLEFSIWSSAILACSSSDASAVSVDQRLECVGIPDVGLEAGRLPVLPLLTGTTASAAALELPRSFLFLLVEAASGASGSTAAVDGFGAALSSEVGLRFPFRTGDWAGVEAAAEAEVEALAAEPVCMSTRDSKELKGLRAAAAAELELADCCTDA